MDIEQIFYINTISLFWPLDILYLYYKPRTLHTLLIQMNYLRRFGEKSRILNAIIVCIYYKHEKITNKLQYS